MGNVNGYMDNTLMIGVNEEYKVGLAYLYSDNYNDKHAKVSKTNNPKSKYSKLLLNWNDFTIHLYNLLNSAIIVTPQIYKSSMLSKNYNEYESHKRFKFFCNKYNFNIQKQMIKESKTDLIVDNFKIQLFFSSKPIKYYHDVHSAIPYKKGDNDFYVIELRTHLGDFLILHESILIEQQFIATETHKGRTGLHIFPYDYLKTYPDRKGNFTCLKKYWFSTEYGHL